MLAYDLTISPFCYSVSEHGRARQNNIYPNRANVSLAFFVFGGMSGDVEATIAIDILHMCLIVTLTRLRQPGHNYLAPLSSYQDLDGMQVMIDRCI